MSIHIENMRRRLLEAAGEAEKARANFNAEQSNVDLLHISDAADSKVWHMLDDLSTQELIELIRR